MEWEGFGKATKMAYGQVLQTFKEVKRFKVLAISFSPISCSMMVSIRLQAWPVFGESVLRLDPSMNVILLLTVNVVAIPMTLVFGKLADVKGTKFA